MKIIYILLAFFITNLNAQMVDKVVANQGDVDLKIEMFDAFAYSLPPNIAVDYFIDKNRFENNMITMLNIELINHYIKEKKLNETEEYKEILQSVNDRYKSIDIRKEFTEKLGYENEEFKKILIDFDIKKEFYKKLQYQLTNENPDTDIEELAYERYLVKKKKFKTPERRDISHIYLSFRNEDKSKKEVYEQAQEILKSAIDSKSHDVFESLAVQYSEDPSAKSNKGNLGEFNKKQLDKDLAPYVFKEKETGVIQRLLESPQGYFIIKINEIHPSKQIPFEQAKADLMSGIKTQTGQRKFQNILSELSKNKLDLNLPLIEKVMNRYSVLKQAKAD